MISLTIREHPQAGNLVCTAASGTYSALPPYFIAQWPTLGGSPALSSQAFPKLKLKPPSIETFARGPEHDHMLRSLPKKMSVLSIAAFYHSSEVMQLLLARRAKVMLGYVST